MQHDRPTDRDETTGPEPENSREAEGSEADREHEREEGREGDPKGSGRQFARGVPPESDRDRDDSGSDPQGSGKQFARGVPPDPGPPERP